MSAPARPLGPAATAGAVFAVGFAVSLAGDACHVASGTTRYEWSGAPEIWNSQVWFPFVVGGAVLGAAWVAERAGLPAVRSRNRADAVRGAALVLALYALTAVLRGEPATVSVTLTAGLALALWPWWDPSPRAFAIAAGAAVLGPAAEALLVAIDASSYAEDTDGLAGVAPWLPCLYFGAGAVAAGLWDAIARDGAPRG